MKTGKVFYGFPFAKREIMRPGMPGIFGDLAKPKVPEAVSLGAP